ncbi:MAG: helix-hairpin-helix domain-containing protein [Acidobacteria bacterium]|nr:helix-hairpin-helix domain-containing protein [Acidobacteriota bacterium]
MARPLHSLFLAPLLALAAAAQENPSRNQAAPTTPPPASGAKGKGTVKAPASPKSDPRGTRKKLPSLHEPDPKTGLDPVVAAQAQIKKQMKAQTPRSKPRPPESYLDINTASREELKKLPGVTDELAGKIMAGRPYPTKSKLISGNILSMDVYAGIKDRIAAVQPGARKAP